MLLPEELFEFLFLLLSFLDFAKHKTSCNLFWLSSKNVAIFLEKLRFETFFDAEGTFLENFSRGGMIA